MKTFKGTLVRAYGEYEILTEDGHAGLPIALAELENQEVEIRVGKPGEASKKGGKGKGSKRGGKKGGKGKANKKKASKKKASA